MTDEPVVSNAKLETDLREIREVLDEAKAVARRYRALTGKPLGITGELAEVSAAALLSLDLAEARQPGFDAIRRDGDGEVRVQVKGRRLAGGAGANGRLGRIRLDRAWDAVVLVLLDEDFEVVSMHEAVRADVEKALLAPGSRARNERGQLSVSKFKAIGRRVWPPSPEVAGG